MGLSLIYFVVISPTGIQVSLEPYDEEYTTQSLLPTLVRFWTDQVLPAFEERDRLGEDAFLGWIPEKKRCRAAEE